LKVYASKHEKLLYFRKNPLKMNIFVDSACLSCVKCAFLLF